MPASLKKTTADWRQFAERFPEGVNVAIKPIPRWDATAPKPRSKTAAVAEWPEEISTLHGARTVATMMEQGGGLWPSSLSRHAYSVGSTFSGDELIQIASGRSQGHVLLIDHETSSETIDELAANPKLTTDQLVRVLTNPKDDVAVHLADSMVELYREFSSAHAEERKQTGVRLTSAPVSVGALCSGSNGNLLLGPEYTGGALQTTVDGSSMTALRHRQSHVNSMVWNDKILLVCSYDRLMRSTNDGASFETAFVPPRKTGTLESVGRERDSTIWVSRGEPSEELGYSDDGGETFKWLKSPGVRAPRSLRPVASGMIGCGYKELIFIEKKKARALQINQAKGRIDQAFETSSGALILVAAYVGTYRSEDKGKTWKKCKGPVDEARCGFEVEGALFIGHGRHVFKSTDDGVSFSRSHTLKFEIRDGVRHGAFAVFATGEGLHWVQP